MVAAYLRVAQSQVTVLGTANEQPALRERNDCSVERPSLNPEPWHCINFSKATNFSTLAILVAGLHFRTISASIRRLKLYRLGEFLNGLAAGVNVVDVIGLHYRSVVDLTRSPGQNRSRRDVSSHPATDSL
jgi:hypothetical protein